jgi:hypothetical protein
VKIIAVDPGYTTGMAFRLPDGILQTCVCTSKDEVLEMIQGWTNIVLIERFATGGTLSAPGLHTIELGAEIIGWCKAKKIEWLYRAPTQRYGGMPLARGAVGHLIPSSATAKHEVDALAHIFAYEMDRDLVPLEGVHWKPKGAAGPTNPKRRTGSPGRPKHKTTGREQVERMKDRYK